MSSDGVGARLSASSSAFVALMRARTAARSWPPHYASKVSKQNNATDAAVRDARTAARDARDEMIRRAESAWRMPGRDAAPGPDEPDNEPDADDLNERMRRHL